MDFLPVQDKENPFKKINNRLYYFLKTGQGKPYVRINQLKTAYDYFT